MWLRLVTPWSIKGVDIDKSDEDLDAYKNPTLFETMTRAFAHGYDLICLLPPSPHFLGV